MPLLDDYAKKILIVVLLSKIAVTVSRKFLNYKIVRKLSLS